MTNEQENVQRTEIPPWYRRLYDWIRKYILNILFYLALGLIGVWIFYAFNYSYKAISKGVYLLPNDIGRVYYPEYLLLFSEPSSLQIDFTQKAPEPLTVMLHFTDTIQAQASPTMTARIITLTVGANQTITSTTISLQNAGTWNGWKGKDESVRIEVFDQSGKIDMEGSNTFTIKLEGRYNAIIRQFVASTVNQNSPLILASVVLVALVRVYMDYQERWRKEQQEIDLVFQQKITARTSDLRKFWREGNLKDAERMWQTLQTDSTALAKIEPTIQCLAFATEKLLNGKNNPATIRQLVDETGDTLLAELAGILIYMGNTYRRNPKFSLPSDFMALKAFFPWHKLMDATQRGDLWRTLKALDSSDFQNWILNYPVDIDLPYPDPLSSTSLFNVCNKRDPLRHANAQDEQSTLFRAHAYWGKTPNQPLQEWLSKTTASSVVYGVPGCGRTALALALCHQYHTTTKPYHFYPLYLHSQPNLPEIKKGVSRYLLHYIGQKPTLALDFSEAVRVQFVRLLSQGLTQVELKAQMEKYQSQTDEWLTDTTDAQRSIWHEAGTTQLKLLSEIVSKLETDDILFEHEAWVKALVQCVQAWGFSGIRLVVDSILIDNPEEVISNLQPWLFPWYHSGMIVTLFLPVAETEINKVQQKLRWLHIPELHFSWSNEELKALVEHRITKVCQVDDASIRRGQCFDQEGTYNEFINAAAGKPQKLVELWNECLRQLGEAPKITRDIVRQARNRL